ncbi:HSP20-like chaperone [Mycena leptocephala]|nr:HSP20-like chaperone [Mycena leptocephala]
MSDAESTHRRAARELIKRIRHALRKGDLRIVHPDPNAPFRPRMEVYDDPDSPNIVATFELPGVPIREIKISVKQGVLMIYGERHARYSPMAVANRHPSVRAAPSRPAEAGAMDVDRDSAAEDAHAKLFPVEELRYGRFQRAIRLPAGVDASCINASISDGLLTVIWPRTLRSPPAAGQGVKQEQEMAMAMDEHKLQRPTSSVRHGAEPQPQPRGGSYEQ